MHRKWIILALLLLIGIVPTAAQGIIVPPPGLETNPDTLKIDYMRVNVEIENQIALTTVDMQFTNEGEILAEGTFLFPLPPDATVDNLIMFIDGVPIEGKILPADEAKNIYVETVRRLIDPALLEYVGMNAIEASIFPIPPNDSRRIQITYGQILEADNGLIHYVFPVNNGGTSARNIEQMSISVNVSGNDPISNIYSPSHNIGISREGATSFRTGYEANNIIPNTDFSLFYGLDSQNINANLLTYRESATEDGFFMLLVQPPITVPDELIVPKDVIIVLDQSGSMEGTKWDQGREAATYVLDNLNPNDRFNLIVFSTGTRVYGNGLLDQSQAQGAVDWMNGLFAEGGTNINDALSQALNLADAERSTTVLFLTDGLATEGVIETGAILSNLEARTSPNVRIFTFGVGDDVDTFLLDAIVRDHRGTGSYVRPTERIDEEVASLYNKISSPVLTNITLEISDVITELTYPQQLPDLFAGEQLTLVGRFRGSADNATIRLSGTVNGQQQVFSYPAQVFPEVAGGEDFIARLWATRRIGDLLNSIRLNGENPELVDSVVSLSIRYGIITPYTSFLIEEDDILSQDGRDRAFDSFEEEAETLATSNTGAGAVDAADTSNRLQNANAPVAPPSEPNQSTTGGYVAGEFNDQDGNERQINPIQTVGGKTFILQGDVWTDTTFEPDTMETQPIVFLSDEYLDLITERPELADYFALGSQVIVVVDGTAYEVVPEA